MLKFYYVHADKIYDVYCLADNPMEYKTSIFLIIIFMALGAAYSFGENFISYVDENGVRVYTNIPPAGQSNTESQVSAEAPASQPKSLSYDEIIEKYAGDYQVDPLLIKSIIATESGFNHKAVSPKGARGLMQLMPATAQRLGVRNSFDPEENIRGGIRHFRSLMDSFNNNLELSLAAYNAGENLVRRLGRIPDYRETKEYVASVKRKYVRNDIPQLPDEEHPPELISYLDEDGVLHLTNIVSPR
jgi:soluble lytic murein transglycosylase-like protein